MILNRKQKQKNLDKGVKLCTKCNTKKPLSDYFKNAYYWDGLSVYCKDCQQGLYKKHYQNNKETILKKMSIYREKKLKEQNE